MNSALAMNRLIDLIKDNKSNMMGCSKHGDFLEEGEFPAHQIDANRADLYYYLRLGKALEAILAHLSEPDIANIDIWVEGGVISDITAIPAGTNVNVWDYDVEGKPIDEFVMSPQGFDCIHGFWEGGQHGKGE